MSAWRRAAAALSGLDAAAVEDAQIAAARGSRVGELRAQKRVHRLGFAPAMAVLPVPIAQTGS